MGDVAAGRSCIGSDLARALGLGDGAVVGSRELVDPSTRDAHHTSDVGTVRTSRLEPDGDVPRVPGRDLLGLCSGGGRRASTGDAAGDPRHLGDDADDSGRCIGHVTDREMVAHHALGTDEGGRLGRPVVVDAQLPTVLTAHGPHPVLLHCNHRLQPPFRTTGHLLLHAAHDSRADLGVPRCGRGMLAAGASPDRVVSSVPQDRATPRSRRRLHVTPLRALGHDGERQPPSHQVLGGCPLVWIRESVFVRPSAAAVDARLPH